MTGFQKSQWVWGGDTHNNHFMLFARTVPVPESVTLLQTLITASNHYELFINGDFINRGPVHGDPQWCLYDRLTTVLATGTREIHVAIVVRHSANLHLRYMIPGPPGLRAELRLGDTVVGTDSSWRCMTLPMWDPKSAKRGPALDYIEDYDARREPAGWAGKTFADTGSAPWSDAIPVVNADTTWGGYQERPTPLIRRQIRLPHTMQAWKAPSTGAERAQDIPAAIQSELLEHVGQKCEFSLERLNHALATANAFTFDLSKEYTGFPMIELDAPAGVTIEISTAERFMNGRPLVSRWETSFSTRYVTREGRQSFRLFAWDGFQYIHVVIRGRTDGIRWRQVAGLERRSALASRHNVSIQDPLLASIFRICEHTLEISAQELMIDCPSREQAPAWADSLVMAEALWSGYEARGYLNWYLEAWLHAPLDGFGQISGRYPCVGRTWLDFTIIPLLGQLFHRSKTGQYYKPDLTVAKALQLKEWYNRERNAEGLLEFPFAEYFKKGLRNFIDHPGLHTTHAFPHPALEREGISCGLNTFYYGFVRILAHMAAVQGHSAASELKDEAARLAKIIPERFFDGEVFHDALTPKGLSCGTAWQTNGLAVLYELVDRRQGADVMKRMLSGYDRLCRCTPYFQFYFLQALRKTGLEEEAMALIKREWGPMIEKGSSTTWETFQDYENTSLCHPWSTMPFIFLVDSSVVELPEIDQQ